MLGELLSSYFGKSSCGDDLSSIFEQNECNFEAYFGSRPSHNCNFSFQGASLAPLGKIIVSTLQAQLVVKVVWHLWIYLLLADVAFSTYLAKVTYYFLIAQSGG